MTSKLQPNYKDWFDGEVTLQTTSFTFSNTDEPVVVGWDDFAKEETIKIKKKQKELFWDISSVILKGFQSSFEKQFDKSKMKDVFLSAEIKQCERIMYAKIPQGDFVTLKHWDTSISTNDLRDMQRHIKRFIIRGIEDGYDFIHSPNNKYQIQNQKDPCAYAQAIWDYCEWLKENYKNTLDKTTSYKKDVKESSKVETKNKYPMIFKNVNAYEFFLELSEMTVEPSTVVADYAFIYYKMKDDGYIGESVKHKAFIRILNEGFNADISAEKFPYKRQKNKKLIYSKLIKSFKPQIDHSP